jgi:glutamyl/glutaminyl-tRNA synthetase
LSKEIDRYESRLYEENAPQHMHNEKDRMREVLSDVSEAAQSEPAQGPAEPEQEEIEQELSAFQDQSPEVTEDDLKQLFELVEENSERLDQLSQQIQEQSSNEQDLSAVNQEIAGLRGRTQQNEREIQRILDTVEELSEILKTELKSGGL